MRSPTSRDQTLGGAGQAYLKAIYELQVGTGRAATSAVAQQLGVSAPSTTRMMKKLAALGLLSHTPYHGAELTPAGEALARRAVHRRELIARYLIQFLDYPARDAAPEADRLEHAVSEKFEHRIAELLGHPPSAP